MLAPKTIFWNRSGVTSPEHEKVASSPPGASSFNPSRLMSLWPARRTVQFGLAARKLRRVEDHQVEEPALIPEHAQHLEDVATDALGLPVRVEAVQPQRRLGAGQRVERRIDVGDVLGAARQRIDAERAGEAECVEHPPAARLCADDPAVLPLIHVEAGLLPAEQIDLETEIVLPDFEIGRRRLAPGQPAAQRQTLLPPYACVRSLDDPRGANSSTSRPRSSSRRTSTPSVRNWTTSQSA